MRPLSLLLAVCQPSGCERVPASLVVSEREPILEASVLGHDVIAQEQSQGVDLEMSQRVLGVAN